MAPFLGSFTNSKCRHMFSNQENSVLYLSSNKADIVKHSASCNMIFALRHLLPLTTIIKHYTNSTLYGWSWIELLMWKHHLESERGGEMVFLFSGQIPLKCLSGNNEERMTQREHPISLFGDHIQCLGQECNIKCFLTSLWLWMLVS